jgi:hypothetical protein
VAAILAGTSQPPYTLDDMADDTAALLDAVGVPAAHAPPRRRHLSVQIDLVPQERGSP